MPNYNSIRQYLLSKSWRSFLYRRLSRFITCEMHLEGGAKISLESKYEVASFNDVFCHPFYWQVFNFMDSPPRLVVDCGAHCGHFAMLADVCLNAKFGGGDAHYILIEPNPHLLPTIRKNFDNSALSDKYELKHGLLGSKMGSDTIWVDSKNYLTSSLHSSRSSKPYVVPYIDLGEAIGEHSVDLMKIDIEGGEFEFVRHNMDVLARVNLLFLELHQASEGVQRELLDSLSSVGLRSAAQPVTANGQLLMIFKRT